MAKTRISDYSQTASNNTDINSININEGCPPSTINNAIRELMKQIKDFQVGAQGDGLTVSSLVATTVSASGVMSAPTASPGTNTTQVATTAFVTAADTAERSATATLTNKTINLANNTLVATSAQVASAVTDETGTGALVFANSPALAGTPTAPTAAGGTNTTQLATTAFVKAAVDAAMAALYPVGSIYTNAVNATNPATLLGFGTWTAFGAGRVMVGFNGSDPLFDTAEETGGSKDAIVVSHTHTASTSITDPGHKHDNAVPVNNATFATFGQTSTIVAQELTIGGNDAPTWWTSTNTTGVTASTTVNSTGSSATNANLQPYITVYLWKRTA